MRNAWTSATTRATGVVGQRKASQALLSRHDVVTSPESGMRYRIGALLGEGGYGQVYLADRLDRSTDIPVEVCVKVSLGMDGWLREAYFGQVLHRHPRALTVFENFPLAQPEGRFLYCLVLEYARHGDLSAYLQRRKTAFPERVARREITGILEVLDRLHRGQTMHRDLTPFNVFVCEGGHLKLGDFGIARQQSDRRGIPSHTLNPFGAPREMLQSLRRWQARDDVFQVGQLLGMLVKGSAERRIETSDVRSLQCTDELKEVLHRCIGARGRRYETAGELIAALQKGPQPLRVGRVKTLKGVHLAFTGILKVPRKEAIRAAKRCGAIVHGGPSAKTSVIVRGRPNTLQAAGKDGGLKLMELKRLRERGHDIKLIGEAQFWALVGKPPQKPRAKALAGSGGSRTRG